MFGRDNVVVRKSYAFAVKIVNLHKELMARMRDYTLARQLLKSGTSIGANVHEGLYAQSNADFLNKMSIALKEASETEYWLNLLHDTDYLTDGEFTPMICECKENLRLLTAITRTTKNKINEGKTN